MRGIPFNFQGQGVLEKWKEEEVLSFLSNEPTSVLDTRRSPSPPTSTSTSTLASSFAGGGGSTGSVGVGGGGSADNTPGVAAGPLVSDNCLQKWPVSLPLETNPPDPGGVCGGGSRKDEWAAELQPITSGLVELVAGGAGEERCGGLGLGLEDWESMLSESAAASPGHEQSLLGWISGDVDDPSFGLKHLLQSGGNPLEFDGNAGMGMLYHSGAVFEASGAPATGNLITTLNPSFLGIGGSGFSANNNNNGKIASIAQNLSTGVVNYKASTVGLNNNYNPQNPVFSGSLNNLPLPVSLSPGMIYQQQQQQQQLETPEEKPQIFNAQPAINHHQRSQNPNYFPVPPYTQQDQHHLLQPPQAKRHNPGGLDPNSQMPKVPFADLGHEFLLRRQQQQPLCFTNQLQLLPQHQLQQKPLMLSKQKMVGGGEEMAPQSHHQQQQQQQQQALLDQLCKAAELVGTGNFSIAQGILARLNHQLSPEGKPFQRAAFYFKEALQLILMNNNPAASPPLRSPTPFDVIFKMGAYKVFSDVSPLIQFANFTCNQALLEALDDADRIHIIDFDIGFGAQWASFMQELPVRNRGAPSLKITALASPSTTHHPLELKLLRENLTLFADEIGIAFELQVVNFDSFDPVSYSMPYFRTSENEAIVVNFPIWSSSNHPAALPLLLRFIKQLSPKLMVSLDRGCDRGDLPLQQHLLHGIQSYTNLLESLDATNAMTDTVSKIERFLFQPRIESTTLGRLRSPDKMPPWKTLFASAGFTPVSFSNFTESQADCVVKRTLVRGFHVEKRQALLILCWQNRELISASAWRC